MNAIAQDSLHYLVVDVREGQPVLVFLGHDPSPNGGPVGEPVSLQLLSPMERFGRPGRPSFGRPVLGKSRDSSCFREFCTAEDLWEAGYLPVPSYRVCDDWLDYHDPWSARSHEDETRALSEMT